MKHILKFIGYVLLGIFPALQGAIVVYDLQKAITYIGLTASTTGWDAVVNCLCAVVYLVLMIWFMFDLGRDLHHTLKWRVYKKDEPADTISGRSEESETSDETASMSPDK